MTPTQASQIVQTRTGLEVTDAREIVGASCANAVWSVATAQGV